MKKTICIEPVNATMEAWATAVKLLNDFQGLGYKKREEFVEIIAKHNPEYQHNFKRIQQLHYFWAMRDRSQKLLKDLSEVLELLQANTKSNN